MEQVIGLFFLLLGNGQVAAAPMVAPYENMLQCEAELQAARERLDTAKENDPTNPNLQDLYIKGVCIQGSDIN